ncbi:Protein kinase domain-containing protein [Mycena sanguinolenta]|uniref:Protein kinase domain-containing protein n=1 Tax=Mycena sanguinolenta TaxID=230812 RepID=A0A8H6YUN1_9AGAR|nr:Protein kinase domain-containing protein [Mycena sanguinolenta]
MTTTKSSRQTKTPALLTLHRPLSPPMSPGGSLQTLSDDDRWALSYINVAHLQPILEAVDDDGSGFVSIAEANNFASKRPKGWSLPQWVAFWAAGWHPTVTWYKNRIRNILYAMNNLMLRIHPANTDFANTYFAGQGISQAERLLRSTRSAPSRAYEDPHLRRLAEQFQYMEEEKLKTKLEELLYYLDDTATIRGITGQRRIERYIFPILYLLLRRHLDILHLATVHILFEAEFTAMASSLSTLFTVVDERLDTLEAVLKSNSLDPKERLGHFAFGMFQALYDPELKERGGKRRSDNTIVQYMLDDGYEWEQEYHYLDIRHNDDQRVQKATFDRLNVEILRYGHSDEWAGQYEFDIHHPSPVTPVSEVDGTWVGRFMQLTDDREWGPLTSVVITSSGDEFTGAAESYYYGLMEIKGTFDSKQKKIDLVLVFNSRDAAWHGDYDPHMQIIEGSMPLVDEDNRATDVTLFFFLRRVPADAWRFLYSDTELAAGAARARWRFAIAATLHEVRRRNFSRSYMRNRLQEAKRWMELVKKARTFNRNLTPASPLTTEEAEELQRFNAVVRPCDAQFYSTVVDHQLQQLVTHGCFCDGCSRDIHGARQFCVQCMDATFSDWVDICSSCIEKGAVPQQRGFTHLLSHLQIKVYRYLHDGDMAWTIPEAKVIAGRAKKTLKLAASADASAETAAVKTKTTLTSRQDNETTTTAFQRPQCASCGEAISPPCFVCIFCTPDVYTCMKCESNRLSLNPDPFAGTAHKLFHALVYIFNTDPIPEIVATDAKLNNMGKNITDLDTRMTSLESKMTSLDSRMNSVDQRLEALEQRLENRLQALENILHAVGEKLLGGNM